MGFHHPMRLPTLGAAILSSLVLLGSTRGADAPFRRADSNADGVWNISDPLHILGYLFLGNGPPSCLDAADVDDDGKLTIADPIYLLTFLFLGGPAPADPFSACGSDATAHGLGCEAFSACETAPVYVNIQVDAELDDVAGIQRIVAELKARAIPSTVYVTADYANRHALDISAMYQDGFEIALHGYYTGEQLATMTYEEQIDLLSRAKAAVEGCKPCGVYKPVVGFRPQYFSQNEDTFRALGELGIAYNSGFKCCQLYLPGHSEDEAPYGHDEIGFSVLPISTIPYADDRLYLCDIASANVQKLTGEEWRAALMKGLEQSLTRRIPLVLLLHGWYTGDSEQYDYWQPFLDLLDAADGSVTFVSSKELVDLYAS